MKKEVENVWPLRFVNTESKKRTRPSATEPKVLKYTDSALASITEQDNSPYYASYFKKSKVYAKRKQKHTIQMSVLSDIEADIIPEFGFELFHLSHIAVETNAYLLHIPNLAILPFFSGYTISNLEEINFVPEYCIDESIGVLNLHYEHYRLCKTLRLNTIRKLLQLNGFEFAKLSSTDTLVSIRECIIRFYFGEEYCKARLLWSTFEENVYQWFRLITEESNRNVIMLIEKLKGKTLESIGGLYNLTRERVRQIVKRVLSRINVVSAVYLDEIHNFAFNFLEKNYGISSLKSISNAFAQHYNWKYQPSTNLLKAILTLKKSLFTIDEEDDWVYLHNNPCITCKDMPIIIAQVIKDFKYLHVRNVIPHIAPICKKCKCTGQNEIPEELIMFHIKSVEPREQEITVFDDVVVEKKHYKIQHGSVIKSAIMYLQNYGKPMHFTEISRHLREYRKQAFSDHNVHSSLNLSKQVLLWDKGTFVHIDAVDIPVELMHEVEKWLIDYLSSIDQYPCLSVYGALHRFENELAEYDIVSAQALYSCLRVSNNPALGYPRYPYVHLSTKPYETPYVFLEKYIRDAMGWVQLDDATYVLQEIMLFEHTHALNVTKDIANCIVNDDFNCIHKQNLKFATAEIEQLVSKCLTTLEGIDNASVSKLYTEHNRICNKMQITGPKMLFSVLQNYAPAEFNLSCYPQVWPASKVKTRKVKNISRHLNEYVANLNRPLTFEDIKEEFCDIRGYNAKSIYQWFIFNKNLFAYDGVQKIHKALINWTTDKQTYIESLVTEFYKKSVNKYGFSTIERFMEEYKNQLPLLPNNYIWTNDLVYAVMNEAQKIKVFGSARNAFSIIPNQYDVYNLEDVVVQILHLHFKGRAPINDITEILHNLNVQKGRLSPAVLARTPNLKVRGNEVTLTIYSM